MNPRGEECVLFSAATEILMRYEEEEEKNWIEPTRLRPADPSGQDLFFIIFSSCYFDLEVKKIKKKWNNIMEIPLGIDFLLKKDV